jgi:hypothetical protein
MINRGEMYRIKMDNKDGIKPKNTNTYRYKYIIIIGYDCNNLYGVVVTNTRDHPLIPIEFQYPLKHNEYDCFVNCYKLYEVSSARLTQDCFQGSISDDDYKLIVGCVRTSPLISKKVLKKFHIS